MRVDPLRQPTPRSAPAARHGYRVFGLNVESDTPLPEPEGSATTADPNGLTVRVWWLADPGVPPPEVPPFMTWTLPSGELWLRASRAADHYLLEFPGLADFQVSTDGCEVWCHPLDGTSAETARHLFLDQVLPLVLNLRGREALHATAVLTPGGVCAFTGAAGTGKSTLAASFLHAGHALVSDDCLALTEDDGRILAWPAYPGLRLWDDALDALAVRRGTRPVAAYTLKRRVTAGPGVASFPATPHPLARVYVLARGGAPTPGGDLTAPRLDRLPGSAALMALVESAFRLDIEDRAMLRRQLDFLARVAARVPVARLHVPTDFSALPRVREAVLADLARG